LVAQMSKSEKTMVDAVHKLYEKMDDYNNRSLSSDVAKVQS
jgi:hypothetical protein